MRIRSKLAWGFAGVIAVILVGSGITYFSLTAVIDAVEEVQLHSDEMVRVAGLQLALSQVVMPANDYLITGDPVEGDNFSRLAVKVEESFAALEGILDLTGTEKALLSDMKAQYSDVREKSLALLAVPDPVGNRQAGEMMLEMDAVADEAITNGEKLQDLSSGHLRSSAASAVRIRARVVAILAVALTLALAGSATIVFSLWRSVDHSVNEVTRVAHRLAASSEELSAGAEEMSTSGEEIAVTMQDVARGAEVQAEHVAATSRSVQQLVVQTGQIAANAETTGSAAHHARDVVDSAAKALQALGGQTERIDEIVVMIEKFADQTNLLALNAAIEAARAGEHGRSFAVVADEVRTLADSSSHAVGQIASLSRGIRGEIGRLMASMDEAMTAVATTSQVAAETSNAADGQQAESERIVQAVNEVASVAEQNASAAEEVAAAVEEQTTVTQQMAEAVHDLADMAGQLQALVTRL